MTKLIFIATISAGTADRIEKFDVTDWENKSKVGEYICPTGYSRGYSYNNLFGDGTYLYWVGLSSDYQNITIRKIRISNMVEEAYNNLINYPSESASVCVVGNYVYVALSTPKLLKFQTSDLSLVGSLNLESTGNYSTIENDPYDSQILWVGLQQSFALYYRPIIQKIDLTSFSVIATKIYSFTAYRGAPHFAIDDTYLYCFGSYRDRWRVLKTNLNTYDQEKSDSNTNLPTRYKFVIGDSIFGTFDNGKRICRFNKSTLNYIYYSSANPMGLCNFSESEYLYMIDTSKVIRKLYIGTINFETIGSDLPFTRSPYACWSWATPPTHITIGTLECDAIAWSEEQGCDPAIRQIPLNPEGEFVDTGTFVIDNRRLTITVRLTDAQKITLNDMFNANATITIMAKTESGEDYPRWEYTCWTFRILKEYSYSKLDSDEREWEVELEFYCSSFEYVVSG